MTIKEAIDQWVSINGKRDPRMYLDDNWQSVKLKVTLTGSEQDQLSQWCMDMLPDDHYRMFNKIWFTNFECRTMFVIAWHDKLANRTDTIDLADLLY